MKGTGRFLFHQYLTSTTTSINDDWDGTTTAQQNIQRRRVKFLSDSSPRDVQTALAMISGISEEEEMEMEQFHLQQQQTQQLLAQQQAAYTAQLSAFTQEKEAQLRAVAEERDAARAQLVQLTQGEDMEQLQDEPAE